MTHIEPTVRAATVSKAIAGREILRGCNLTVHPGEVCAVIGPNGAGKTTLFKILTGLVFPTSGSIDILGKPLNSTTRDQILGNIGSVIETPEYRPGTTAHDILQLHFDLLGASNHDSISALLARVGLEGAADAPVASFSLGMRQRLALARAISHRPQLLVLDEPANGLDPSGIADLRHHLSSLADDGIAILLASHILRELEHTAHTVAILNEGRLSAKKEVVDVLAADPTGLEGLYHDHVGGQAQ